MKKAIYVIIFLRFYGKKLFFNLGIHLNREDCKENLINFHKTNQFAHVRLLAVLGGSMQAVITSRGQLFKCGTKVKSDVRPGRGCGIISYGKPWITESSFYTFHGGYLNYHSSVTALLFLV